MMLYKNMKTMIHLPGSDTEFFTIVTGLLQRDSLAQYMFKIWQEYVHR